MRSVRCVQEATGCNTPGCDADHAIDIGEKDHRPTVEVDGEVWFQISQWPSSWNPWWTPNAIVLGVLHADGSRLQGDLLFPGGSAALNDWYQQVSMPNSHPEPLRFRIRAERPRRYQLHWFGR